MKNHYLKVVIGSILMLITAGSFNFQSDKSLYLIDLENSEIPKSLEFNEIKEVDVSSPVTIEKEELSEAFFASNEREGQIGVSDDRPIDNPIDNIFHVNIEEKLRGNENIWLEYELKGVQDYSGISRSINDQLSVGGYLVKKSDDWVKQKELINPNDLKLGDNVIRFTIADNNDYGYQIRNLGIRIEPYSEVQAISNRRLVVNQPSTEYYYGKLGYFQGLVIGDDSEKAKVLVNGEKIRYQKGTFESLVEKPINSNENWSVRIQAIFPDGQELYVDVPFNKPSEWDYTNGFDKEIHSTERLVSNSESFELQLANAKLEGDSGCVDRETKFSITALRDIDVPALDAGMVNVTAGYAGYRFLPHGTQFQKDIAVELGYDTTKIPNGYGKNDIKTYFFSEESHHWIAIPKDSALLALNITKSRTNHFSDYINAIIKVPESPETQGYTPTSMKDVKAANPATGVNLINPPSANSMGNANLSYPLNIPAGRQGMQPQLAISYNSGGGNGWMGLGWDLSTPSISVETRWGVPHYDPDDESETYLMSGEQLSPVSHREAWIPRDKSADATKRFYPRVEGSFSKIIRHGTNPTEYWWEVTDKSGVKYYYGGIGSLDNNAVLRRKIPKKDNPTEFLEYQPIVQWTLVKVEDLNGNFVKYEYEIQEDKGVADENASNGFQIYLKKVTYTGFDGQAGKYSVEFKRDREYDGTTNRKDVSISANYGFKQVTADLLRKIDVKFGTEIIRSYELKYKDGAFYKTLLDSIIELDAANEVFTAHGFEYHDDIRQGSDYVAYTETNSDPLETMVDDISGTFINPLDLFSDKSSAISGNQSYNIGTGMYVGVGLGYNVASKGLTLGGSFSYSQSNSNGQLSLIDINGDGLPDKVMLKGDDDFSKKKMVYRPQIKHPDGTISYGEEKNIEGVNKFLRDRGHNFSLGAQVNFVGFGGMNYTYGRSKTYVYFSDVNADGLVDIVDDGSVKYNTGADENGVIKFSGDINDTENEIDVSGGIEGGLVTIDPNQFKTDQDRSPLHDVVKMWRAPYSGVININAPVNLIEDMSDDRVSYQTADGVKVSIQLRDEKVWEDSILQTGADAKIPYDVNNLTVNKGDKVYFRVQSRFDGMYDQVNWSPEIYYTDKDTTLRDANNLPVYKFNSEEDFLMAVTKGKVYVPIKGTINIESRLIMPALTDDVRVEIICNDTVIENVFAKNNKKYDIELNQPDLKVNKNDSIEFKIYSGTNVDWAKVQWSPYLYYTHSEDTVIKNDQLFDKEGNPVISFYTVPQVDVYSNVVKICQPWAKPDSINTDDSLSVSINPMLTFKNKWSDSLSNHEKVVFAVKTNDTLLYKDTIDFRYAITSFYPEIRDTVYYSLPENITKSIKQTDKVFLEYYTSNLDFAKLIDSTHSTITYSKNLCDTIAKSEIHNYESTAIDTLLRVDNYGVLNPDTLTVNIDLTNADSIYIYNYKVEVVDTLIAGLYSVPEDNDQIFGNMYRNWGQFIYDGMDERKNTAINQDLLNIDRAKEVGEGIEEMDDDEFSEVSDTTQMNNTVGDNAYDPQAEKFFMMIPISGTNSYFRGVDDLTFVTANTLSSSRKGEKYITPPNPIPNKGSGFRAVDKNTNSHTVAFNIGFSVVGGSGSTTTSTLVTDFMDMNGDRYPDIVTKDKIQYTMPQGNLTQAYTIKHDIKNHRSLALSGGISIGGEFPESKKDAGGNQKSASTSVSGSGSFGNNYGINAARFTWRDINGDGMPDRINKNTGMVELNLGYSFASPENWGNPDIYKGQSKTTNGGIGVNYNNGSIKAGLSYSRSNNKFTGGLQDINGDGLADLIVDVNGDIDDITDIVGELTGISEQENVKVRLNTGNGFGEEVEWKGAQYINENKTTTEGLNVAFTFGITTPWPVKFVFTPSGNVSHSYSSQTVTLNDIDGDGNPDYLESDSDDKLIVRSSNIRRTNLLKVVHRPLNAKFELDYKPVGNTYEMPQAVWALSRVSINDGYVGDGENKLESSFEYANGYHDRRERAFYGFGEVKSHQLDKNDSIYRTTVQNFNNDNYYEKGLLLSESVQDKSGKKYVETINTYELKTFKDNQNNDVQNVYFSVLKRTDKEFFEKDEQISTYTTFEYGAYGNVTEYTDYGTEGDDSDNISATITYHENNTVIGNNILSIPSTISVSSDIDGELRYRSTTINDTTGKITGIRQKIDASTWAEYEMYYNNYGNMDSIVRPANYNGERMYFAYDYDDEVYNYITSVRDAYGYSSLSTYNYKFGQVLSTTDINGHKTKYQIDTLGRIIKITGPYELDSGQDYTIRFKYYPNADIPWARTQHYDPDHPENPIETAIFIDGLGRVLQTKKDAALFMGKDTENQQIRIVSGKVTYDEFGRAIESRYPVTDTKAIGTIETDVDDVNPSKVEYDILDRTLLTTLPDSAKTESNYSIGNDPLGLKTFITTVTDANGISTSSYTDVKGRQTVVKAPGDIITSFVYNAINELTSVTDAENNTTVSVYDKLGRRLSRLHPDAGLTEYVYDATGNMLKQITANLRETNQEIIYDYNYNRLTNITYPQNTVNNVRFEYGEAGAEHNRAGRIVLQEDATGAQEFFYGPLGEITKNIRTIIVPDEGIYTFETKWEYDTWNRLKKMTYPDGEELNYSYNKGGLLQNMYGTKKGHKYNYLTQIGYDKFEDREYIAYGNGTETNYEYEPDRRRLNHIATTTSVGRKIMDNTYTYDDVNNIKSLKGIAPIPEEGFLGGNFEYNYTYDELYRLETATGQWSGYEKNHRYDLEMEYSSTGSIKHKNQLHEEYNSLSQAWEEKNKTTYDWDYKYEGEKPHAPSQIGENTYDYDANGNQIGWQSTVNNQRRDILWDEENRIRAIADNGQTHHYMYDASGERVIKARGDGQAIYINGFPMGGAGTVGSYTMYVSPYMVATSARFTKHYYIEGQRIVSKIGEPAEFQHIFPTDTVIPAGGDNIDWELKGQALKDNIYTNFEALGLDGAVFAAGRSGKVPYGRLKKYYRNSSLVNGNGSSTTQTDTVISNKYEKFQYFYHPDHLGSSSFISDASGEVQQHMEYFPFGETFVEEHHGHDRYSNYKFNGKELDEETGLYYYGARYYDPRISMWYGVDIKLEDYPSWSPYNYTLNNPVINTDPDGLSTHTDIDGNVITVVDDGDMGVYRHPMNADGGLPTEYMIKRRQEKWGSAAHGEKMGKTEHWDEFINPESGESMRETKIQFGKSFDPIINEMNDKAQGMTLTEIASESGPTGDFDIKVPYRNVGGLLEGKYASARSAGNYLAGYNAQGGTIMGQNIEFKTFQKLAGALHVKGSLTASEKARIVLFGKSYGPPPTYGEIIYQYRMSKAGWDAAASKSKK